MIFQNADGKTKNSKSSTTPGYKLQPREILDNRAGLQLANSLANGPSTLASLKDISQKMFQVRLNPWIYEIYWAYQMKDFIGMINFVFGEDAYSIDHQNAN